MEDSNNFSRNEQWNKIPYRIKRESKILKFNDINEVEEETSYLIKFNKFETSEDSNYMLELPLTYFRIPEKTIQEYQDYLEVKEFFKTHKLFKKYIEEFEDIRKILNEYETLLVKIKDKGDFSEKMKFYEKMKKNMQEIENSSKYQELEQKYGLAKHPIKNLNTILIETKSEILFEKIIWHFIFEEIFDSSDSYLKNTKKFIEREIRNPNRETKSWKIKLPRNIKTEISEINIRDYIEKSGNFENIINYPYLKKKPYLHHNTSLNWFIILYIVLFPVFLPLFIYLSEFLIIPHLIFWIITVIILSASPLLIIKFLIHVKKAKNKINKLGKLKEKFEEKIKQFLHNENNNKKISEENKNMKLFLDSLSEILFTEIYKFVFRDLDKCIRDYKSFNPVSIEIFFEGNRVFPIKTSYEDFFHKTSIPLNIDTLSKEEAFSLKIITNKTIRKNKKKSRMLNSYASFPKNYQKAFFISVFVISGISVLSKLLNFNFSDNLVYILTILLLLILNPILFIRTEYSYFSSLLTDSNEELFKKKLSIAYLFAKRRKIFSITVDLREDCSYYFLAYAPKFHRIKFTKEMKEILRGLFTKLPTDLSSDIVSFNIPRRKRLKRELEFDIDLEIPISGRIWCWIIGIFIMLGLMCFSGIMYIISIINPSFFVKSFDLSTLRFVLTFLTLLIGFFGKDILSEPTKDLHKIGLILIITSLIVGIIFVAPIFITLLF